MHAAVRVTVVSVPDSLPKRGGVIWYSCIQKAIIMGYKMRIPKCWLKVMWRLSRRC